MRERWAAEGAATEMCISVMRLVCGYLLDRSNAEINNSTLLKTKDKPSAVHAAQKWLANAEMFV